MNESNTERLERIKNQHERGTRVFFDREDIDWLIKQTERTAELEDEVSRLKLDAAKSIPLYSRRKLQTDKDRYERALKDIRDVSTGTVNQWAKKALEER